MAPAAASDLTRGDIAPHCCLYIPSDSLQLVSSRWAFTGSTVVLWTKTDCSGAGPWSWGLSRVGSGLLLPGMAVAAAAAMRAGADK
jgi:hypothetical protein